MEEMDIRKIYRQLIEGFRGKIALRISKAYSTVSIKDIQVVTGIIPVHLLVQKRSYEKDAIKREQKLKTRDRTMTKWQEKWEAEITTSKWKKKLIAEMKNWVERKHGEINYYLTHFLS